MSLTAEDLSQIRTIFREEIQTLDGRVEALENYIKEIYSMLKRMEGGMLTDKIFKRLSLEDKLLRINTELLSAAKEAGMELPR